eukprot:COSAG06_NODE_37374_length_436_cov_0.554896_1_plen_41_part_10
MSRPRHPYYVDSCTPGLNLVNLVPVPVQPYRSVRAYTLLVL